MTINEIHNEQKRIELETRRMIYETCDLGTILLNLHLRAAMGW